ncbi:MAG: phosphatase PAP2 family protein [Bryobacteraceae bacterium]
MSETAVQKRAVDAALRTLLTGLLVAIAALVVFAWIADLIGRGGVLDFDNYIRALVHRHSSPALTRIMLGFSVVGSPAYMIVLGCAAVVHFVRSGRPRTAILFVITVLGAELLDQVLKLLFHRTRPVAFFGLAQPMGYSFPSGHSLVSCAFFGVLATFAAARTKKNALRWTYRLSAALLIAAIGISRIYLGVHYPSDVIAGYLAALVWVFSVASARRWMRRARGLRPSS